MKKFFFIYVEFQKDLVIFLQLIDHIFDKRIAKYFNHVFTFVFINLSPNLCFAIISKFLRWTIILLSLQIILFFYLDIHIIILLGIYILILYRLVVLLLLEVFWLLVQNLASIQILTLLQLQKVELMMVALVKANVFIYYLYVLILISLSIALHFGLFDIIIWLVYIWL